LQAKLARRRAASEEAVVEGEGGATNVTSTSDLPASLGTDLELQEKLARRRAASDTVQQADCQGDGEGQGTNATVASAPPAPRSELEEKMARRRATSDTVQQGDGESQATNATVTSAVPAPPSPNSELQEKLARRRAASETVEQADSEVDRSSRAAPRTPRSSGLELQEKLARRRAASETVEDSGEAAPSSLDHGPLSPDPTAASAELQPADGIDLQNSPSTAEADPQPASLASNELQKALARVRLAVDEPDQPSSPKLELKGDSPEKGKSSEAMQTFPESIAAVASPSRANHTICIDPEVPEDPRAESREQTARSEEIVVDCENGGHVNPVKAETRTPIDVSPFNAETRRPINGDTRGRPDVAEIVFDHVLVDETGCKNQPKCCCAVM